MSFLLYVENKNKKKTQEKVFEPYPTHLYLYDHNFWKIPPLSLLLKQIKNKKRTKYYTHWPAIWAWMDFASLLKCVQPERSQSSKKKKKKRNSRFWRHRTNERELRDPIYDSYVWRGLWVPDLVTRLLRTGMQHTQRETGSSRHEPRRESASSLFPILQRLCRLMFSFCIRYLFTTVCVLLHFFFFLKFF